MKRESFKFYFSRQIKNYQLQCCLFYVCISMKRKAEFVLYLLNFDTHPNSYSCPLENDVYPFTYLYILECFRKNLLPSISLTAKKVVRAYVCMHL